MYDALKSFNTKIGRFASQNKNAPLGVLVPLAHLPKISIANLIKIAQPLHPQIFSRDVAATLGVSYEGNQIQAKFSVGNGRPIFNKSLFIAGRARVADPADWGEQTPGALAASSELSNQGVTQMQSYGAIRKMSLPLPL